MIWNKVNQDLPNNTGFDETSVLPYRERLIIVYFHKDNIAADYVVGEAYVHDGKWFWWDSSHPKDRKEIDPTKYKIMLWTKMPILTEPEWK